MMPQRKVTDQMGREVWIPAVPKRIISLVPSQTELLYYLGLTDEVVGQTLFCIHPKEMHASKPRVGGTKKLNMDKIAALKPDLIIGNKEENEQAQIEELMAQYPVWMSDIATIEDALKMIEGVGMLVNRSQEAHSLTARIEGNISASKKMTPKKAIYMIWNNPYMVAGKATFIGSTMAVQGYDNIIEGRYHEVSVEQLQILAPETVVLSSEPFPFKEKHRAALQQILPYSEIILVDGELYSWYGSKMLELGEIR